MTLRPPFSASSFPQRPAHSHRPAYAGHEEPRLDEIMDDPILHRLMASDGVQADYLRKMINRARDTLSLR